MYGIFTYIWVIYGVIVGKYTNTMDDLGIRKSLINHYLLILVHGFQVLPDIFDDTSGRFAIWAPGLQDSNIGTASLEFEATWHMAAKPVASSWR